MKKTKQEVIDLSTAFETMARLDIVPDDGSTKSRDAFRKFRYAFGKNTPKVKAEMSGINSEMEPYQEARTALCEEHSIKDDDGKPVIIGISYQMKDTLAFDKALEVLNKEHKYQETMDTEVKINIHCVKESSIPISVPTPVYMKLMPMFLEEPEDDEPATETEEPEPKPEEAK